MLLGICPDPSSPAAGGRMPNAAPLWERWPTLAAVPPALAWLSMRADLGLAHRSTDAYARGLSEYLAFCTAAAADPLTARREHVARFVRHLTERPSRHAGADAAPPFLRLPAPVQCDGAAAPHSRPPFLRPPRRGGAA